MKIIFSSILFCLTAAMVSAGTIVGHVHAQGKTSADNDAGDGAYASRKYKFIERVDYAAMRDFVVYVDDLTLTNLPPSTNVTEVASVKVSQEGAVFSPHVLPIVVGTTVEWPNRDQIYHNVFSDSDAAHFDLGLYKGNPPEKRVTFDKPGRVDVFCSIHANMNCVVLVLSNPYFATTDANGNFKIVDVPAGKYKLKAWHERLPADEQEIIVPTNGMVKVDFTLAIKNLPQP